MKDSMAMTFREGDFDSHKPLIHTPGGLGTSMNQENPHIHLENVDTIILRKTHLLSDQISPEPTGTTKQPIARPPGSLEVINYNEPNIIISAEFLLQKLSYTFYNSNTGHKLQEKEAERARKQILFKFKGPNYSPDKIFNSISKLISIPSIVIELPEEVVQRRKFRRKERFN
jgi:hypothetical protein